MTADVPLWEPDGRHTRLHEFLDATGHADWPTLLTWSLTDLDGFWRAIADQQGVRWRTPPEGGVALSNRAMPGAVWFPGSELNYAEHALANEAVDPNGIAVLARSQSRADVTLTWSELTSCVARAAAGLRELGVGRGDRVAAYAPNCAETLVLFLATASLGAVWSSCAPEFGTTAVVDRFSQIEPVVLFAVDGYRYGTKEIDRRADATAIADALPSVRSTVTLRHLGTGPDGYADLLDGPDPGPPAFEPVPFAHPLYILYSSGTTGLPKAIVHGHGGITLEHWKALALHHDLRAGERFCWFSTTGWMMWNYLVSGLLVGATVVLFDGDPGYPDLGTLWQLASDTHCDVLGASAPFLMACKREELMPGRDLDLAALRSVGSTGAPLPAEGFRWVTDAVGRRVQVNSISGGTDVCTAFVGMVPILPVYAGKISTRLLGCAVEAFGPDGRQVGAGETGELVVTEPMPSMPVGLWNDDGTKLRATYYDDFPGVWRHGDWITFDADGSCVISGRSDATLNRGGVRLGTGEFYAIVESLPEVVDSLVVHLEDEAAGRLLLFVQLVPGTPLDEELRTRINNALRRSLSPRHVPDAIEVVPAVPRTLSGKKLEVPVKRILTGTPADDAASRGSLLDPTALDWFSQFATS